MTETSQKEIFEAQTKRLIHEITSVCNNEDLYTIVGALAFTYHKFFAIFVSKCNDNIENEAELQKQMMIQFYNRYQEFLQKNKEFPNNIPVDIL